MVHDLTTFVGRLKHFQELVHPKFFFVGDEEILDAQRKMKLQTGGLDDQKLVNACIHGPTGEIIPMLGRVSAIAPVNIPLISAMLSCPATNVPGTLFLHWANQTYNAYCNYCNRAGKEVDINSTAKAYGLAVGSACSLAYGLGKAFERAPPGVKKWGMFIPMLATGAANMSNIGFTRMGEILEGTQVYDIDKREMGLSKHAGLQGVLQTGLSRGLMVPSACLLVPPIAQAVFAKVGMVPKAGSPGNKLFQLVWVCIALQIALPAALATFPQESTYDVTTLEPQFHHLLDTNHRPIKYLYANKGL